MSGLRNNIDTEMITGSSKKAYITVKNLTKTSQPKAIVIADPDANLLTEGAAV
ncbi:hypothetical protein DPMN_040569 [Dreissena polymorpha]|uniref:Uncharacterized protein n=1 Tax=Dreissena polymorpha TaxID=45954 RepID=A0A9D4CWZ3_DREPO|nr:hypothetical protein DPMN_040569 [Dreissena polymorpha]